METIISAWGAAPGDLIQIGDRQQPVYGIIGLRPEKTMLGIMTENAEEVQMEIIRNEQEQPDGLFIQCSSRRSACAMVWLIGSMFRHLCLHLEQTGYGIHLQDPEAEMEGWLEAQEDWLTFRVDRKEPFAADWIEEPNTHRVCGFCLELQDQTETAGMALILLDALRQIPEGLVLGAVSDRSS